MPNLVRRGPFTETDNYHAEVILDGHSTICVHSPITRGFAGSSDW